jgi:hypothetical protein
MLISNTAPGMDQLHCPFCCKVSIVSQFNQTKLDGISAVIDSLVRRWA